VPLLQQVDPEQRLESQGRSASLRLRPNRLDRRDQASPRHAQLRPCKEARRVSSACACR
jgi:hypothetical protein